ncbi:MAG: RNA polymerase sigma factor [Spirochaetales bacterium]|nr:RNA polymerase sigma factor [Spirochaetales bacterium]
MKDKAKLMENIWIEYHPKLQVYLKQILPGSVDLEDRVSDILVKVIAQIDSYNPEFALSTWIYRIARNTQIDEIRKIKPIEAEYDDEIITNSETPEDLFFKQYNLESIRECIEILSPHQRELIFLYFYEGKNYREISEITEIPVGTLKFRMSCCKKIIKDSLEKEHKHANNY